MARFYFGCYNVQPQLCIQENKETSQNVYFVFNFSSILRKCLIHTYNKSYMTMWPPLEKLNIRVSNYKNLYLKKHGEHLLPKNKNEDLFFTFVFQQSEAFFQSYLLSLPN